MMNVGLPQCDSPTTEQLNNYQLKTYQYEKPLQFKQVLAALLTIAALASGLTAHATVQTGIMMQGLARTVNNQTMCTFVIQSNWGGDQIPAQTGSSYTFSNARMIHGTVDVTLNGTLNFQVGTAFADVITGNSFTVTIESSSLWFYGATIQTKNGTNVSGCSTTVSSNRHTLTVTIPTGKTFGAIIVDYVDNPPMTNSNTTVTVPQGNYWVSNANHKPKPEPTVVYGGQTILVKDTDYTLSWSNNSSAGTGTVTVTGIGNYAGSATGNFPIRWARYNVHFDKNHDDATGTMSDQQFTYNTAQALTANTFSRADYSFKGWCTTSNGAVTYTDGQSVSNLTAVDGQTVTLYAKWIPIPCLVPENFAADSVTLTTAEFSWIGNQYAESYQIFYRESESVNVLFSENFEYETTLANWTAISNNTENTSNGRYGRLPSAAHNGRYGYSFSSYSFSSTWDYNQYLISPELTVSGNLEFYYKKSSSSTETFRVGYSSTGTEISDFTWGDEVNVSDDSWNLFFEAMPQGTKYVAINYYSHFMYELYIDDITISTPIPAGEWTTVENIQTDDYLIEGLTDGTDYEVQVQSVCVNEDSETWQWSNMLTFTTIPLPTFTKDIVGYGNDNGGYYLIASPVGTVNPEHVGNMTANAFDLYRFNPSNEDNEWENYKATSFNFENGKGYLYANSDDATLTFTGTPVEGDTYEVTLTYDVNDERKCWNLVGNPFASDATLNREYYVMNQDGTGINPEPIPFTTPIPPCTAVFVKAENDGETVVFSRVTE